MKFMAMTVERISLGQITINLNQDVHPLDSE